MPAFEAGFLFCVRAVTVPAAWRCSPQSGVPHPRVSRIGRGPSAGLRPTVDVAQRLPVVIPDDEAASVVLFDVPWRREAAWHVHKSCSTRASSPRCVIPSGPSPDLSGDPTSSHLSRGDRGLRGYSIREHCARGHRQLLAASKAQDRRRSEPSTLPQSLPHKLNPVFLKHPKQRAARFDHGHGNPPSGHSRTISTKTTAKIRTTVKAVGKRRPSNGI